MSEASSPIPNAYEYPTSASVSTHGSHGSTPSQRASTEAFVEVNSQRDASAKVKSMDLLNSLVNQQDSEGNLAAARGSDGKTDWNQMAESTRKVKNAVEDRNDLTTFASMKSQLDVEREQWAKKRALFLLEGGNNLA